MAVRDLALFRFPPCSLGLLSLIFIKSIKSSTEGYRGGSSSGVKTFEARGSHVISNSEVYWSVSSEHLHQLQRDTLATEACRDDLSTCDTVNILFCFGCCLIPAFSDSCCSRLLGIGIHSNCWVGYHHHHHHHHRHRCRLKLRYLHFLLQWIMIRNKQYQILI